MRRSASAGSTATARRWLPLAEVDVMSASDDYSELGDGPKSQCIHGRPPPKEAVKAAAKPRKRPTATARSSAVAARQVTRRWTPPDGRASPSRREADDQGEARRLAARPTRS